MTKTDEEHETFGMALDEFLEGLTYPLPPDVRILMAVAFSAGWDAK